MQKFKPLKILKYPDVKLRRKSLLVRPEKNLEEVKILIEQMFKAMKFYGGIGLSAPQIGVGLRIITIDLQDGVSHPLAMINPEIVKSEGKIDSREGCLSFPQMESNIERSEKIKVKYLDDNAKEKEMNAEGLLACCIQHEMDHLNGILFIDKMSRMRQEMILKRLKKLGRID